MLTTLTALSSSLAKPKRSYRGCAADLIDWATPAPHGADSFGNYANRLFPHCDNMHHSFGHLAARVSRRELGLVRRKQLKRKAPPPPAFHERDRRIVGAPIVPKHGRKAKIGILTPMFFRFLTTVGDITACLGLHVGYPCGNVCDTSSPFPDSGDPKGNPVFYWFAQTGSF